MGLREGIHAGKWPVPLGRIALAQGRLWPASGHRPFILTLFLTDGRESRRRKSVPANRPRTGTELRNVSLGVTLLWEART